MGCLARWPATGHGCLWIGRDHRLPLIWLAGSSAARAAPVDLTGYGLRAEWRHDDANGALIVAQTIGDGITVEDQSDPATRGRVSLLLPRAVTALLSERDIVVMDIKATAAGLETMFPVQFFYQAWLPVTQS